MTKISQNLADHLKTIGSAELDERGRELLNPIPLQPTGIRPKSKSLREQIMRVVKTELSIEAHKQGEETFDEANDFDETTEFDRDPVMTPYEEMDSHLEQINKSPEPQIPDSEDRREASAEEPDPAPPEEKTEEPITLT